jgi:hypothetical protein
VERTNRLAAPMMRRIFLADVVEEVVVVEGFMLSLPFSGAFVLDGSA